MPRVNPEILVWARKTAGYSSLADAAAAIKLNDTKKATGAERLERLEMGEDEQSRVLLRRMAEKYRRPLITFYLSKPPKTGERGKDFRRTSDAPSLDHDPRLDALIRNVRVRHELAKALLEDEEVQPLPFVGSFNLQANVDTVAQKIAEIIAFDIEQFRGNRRGNDYSRRHYNSFEYLRYCLERAGIFVLLVGDLGSYHSKIDGRIFRGYAIADHIAPFIIINDNDARAAWSFTALHEACHIWLGQTGVSGVSHEAEVERFCNDVASHLLLPQDDLQAMARLAEMELGDQIEEISQSAHKFNVSRRMVAYRLLRNDTINSERYRQLVSHFHDDWLRSRMRDPDTPNEAGGPNAHVVKRHRLGPALMSLAQRSVSSGALSPVKAAKLLGVKPGSVHALLRAQHA